MNYRKITGIALFCLLTLSQANAQSDRILNEPDTKKPKLFTQLPDKIEVDFSELQHITGIDRAEATTVKINFVNTKPSQFSATVVSAANKYEGRMKSCVMRIHELPGATLTLTASKSESGKIIYSGRMISMHHGDLYELKSEDKKYFLIKKNFHELINE